MERLHRMILVFAVLFAAFLILPAFLNARFPLMPLMDVADVFDLLTPLVLLPIYFVLLQWGGAGMPTWRELILFVVFAAMWAQGQGMHLGANSIGHLLETAKKSDAYKLTHFYDEVLSHYVWNVGIVGLAGLLLVRQWRLPFRQEADTMPLEVVAAVIYAVTTFITAIEAGTVFLTLPFSIVVGGFFLLRGRMEWRFQPLLIFFGIAYAIATFLLIGWGFYFRGFPQFSELGIIH